MIHNVFTYFTNYSVISSKLCLFWFINRLILNKISYGYFLINDDDSYKHTPVNWANLEYIDENENMLTNLYAPIKPKN